MQSGLPKRRSTPLRSRQLCPYGRGIPFPAVPTKEVWGIIPAVPIKEVWVIVPAIPIKEVWAMLPAVPIKEVWVLAKNIEGPSRSN